MQSLFLEPAKKGNLAQTSVCYCIALLCATFLTLACSGGIAALALPTAATITLAFLPVALLLYWIVSGSVKVVKILRSLPDVNSSTYEFNAIQVASFALFAVSCLSHLGDFMAGFTAWALCIEIFLALVHFFFVLLGILSKAKMKHSTWIGFVVMLAAVMLALQNTWKGK